MPDDRQGTADRGVSPDVETPSGTPTAQTPATPPQTGPWPAPVPWQAPVSWQPRPWLQPASWQLPGPWPPAAEPWQSGPWQSGPWQSGPWQQPGPWPPPGAWWPDFAAGPYPTTPSTWPIGSVPWGYANPPAVTPILEPPGNFHPPIPPRPALSPWGRQSPRLYALGIILGLPGITVLLLYLASVGAGFKPWTGPVPRWLFLESACFAAAIGLIASAVAQSRQRRADGWRDYRGPSPLVAMGALLGILTALEIPLEAGLNAAGVDLNSGLATLALMVIFLGTYAGVVHFLAVRPDALSWRDIVRPGLLAPSRDDWSIDGPVPGSARRFGESIGSWRARASGSRIGDLLIPAAMVVPLIIASNVLAAAMLLVLGLHPSDIATPELSTPMTGIDRMLLFIAVAILAPIGEEIFFRGFATNAWGRSLSRNTAIVRSSLFFAFIHVLNTSTPDPGLFWRAALFNFGARVPVAFALAWLYMRRRSILASGALHMSYNGVIAAISFLQPLG